MIILELEYSTCISIHYMQYCDLDTLHTVQGSRYINTHNIKELVHCTEFTDFVTLHTVH